MRLIDADKLMSDIEHYHLSDGKFQHWVEIQPTIEPECKTGKWVGKEQFVNSPEFYSWQCSVCGCVLEDPTLDKPYPFCPNCGADMRGDLS